MEKTNGWKIVLAGIMATMLAGLPALSLHAATAKEINVGVDAALALFSKQVKGSQAYLDAAKGILVIPRLAQSGLIVGGEYGEGALRIGGKTVNYYSLAAATLGVQAGVQEKDIILVFLDEEALDKFRSGDGWQAGIDGTVVAVGQDAEGSLDTTKMNQPIVGFIVGRRGLMAGASFEGTKFTKLKR
jgi:lipid-binding SYLF domain-containing protein